MLSKSIEVLRTLAPGKRLKAKVLLIRQESELLVLKSYAHVPWYIKPLALLMIQREVQALSALRLSPYVPEYLGAHGRYGVLMEYIEGVHPSDNTRVCNDQIYRDALAALREIHRTGIVHNDLRSKNMIYSEQRGLVFIDFAAAIRFPVDMSIPAIFYSWFQCRLRRADLYHLVQQKRVLSERRYSPDEIALICRGRPFKWATIIWKRHVLGKQMMGSALQQSLCDQVVSSE